MHSSSGGCDLESYARPKRGGGGRGRHEANEEFSLTPDFIEEHHNHQSTMDGLRSMRRIKRKNNRRSGSEKVDGGAGGVEEDLEDMEEESNLAQLSGEDMDE